MAEIAGSENLLNPYEDHFASIVLGRQGGNRTSLAYIVRQRWVIDETYFVRQRRRKLSSKQLVEKQKEENETENEKC